MNKETVLFYRLIHIIIALGCFAATAQEKQYVFTHLSGKDGLASDHVYAVLQDKKGFMWFGTANGLQRYDGRKIINFSAGPDDSVHISSGAISQLLLDRHNRFWVRMGHQVGIFNSATFTHKLVTVDVPRQDLEKSQVNLVEDLDGNVFFVVSEYGILIYREKMNAFVLDTSVINTPKNARIIAFQQDPRDGNYWFGFNQGLGLYDRSSRKYYTHANNPINNPILKDADINEPVTTFYIDSNQKFWVGNWLYPSNIERFNSIDLRSGRATKNIAIEKLGKQYRELHTFQRQRNGRLWAYGLSILAEFNEATGRFVNLHNENPYDYGIRYRAVHQLYEDRENNVWIATDEGVYIFNPGAQRFTSMSIDDLPPQTGTMDRSINSFTQLKNGDIWAATWGQGIYSFDAQFSYKPNTVIRNPPGNDNNYYMTWSAVEHSATGKIWIGCQAGRLMVFDPALNTTSYFNHPVFDQRTIRTAVEDKYGNIWFGTQWGRIIKWDAAKGSKNISDGFQLVHDLKSHIFRMRVDDSGLLWVGSQLEGVTVLDLAGNVVTSYNAGGGRGRSIYSNQVTDILFYNDSLVFICGSVLNILNKLTGEIRQITQAEGLPGNSANSLKKDEEGNVWIGLINGLCRYNVKRNIFTLFSQKDGIVKNEFRISNSLVLSDGRMVFCNEEDFVFFNPRQILPAMPPPDVSITDFKLFNTYLPPDSILQLDRVVLSHDQNSITIEFAALSFLQKDKMVYYFRLLGIDNEWVRVDRYNIANFTLLPPGEYTFQVRCENGDGIPSRNHTSLKIYVRPPFWRQEWFVMLAIMALAGLIYLAHRLRVGQLMEMEKVRGRIARDLHDDMGSTLSTINILSEMAKMKVDTDAKKTGEYIGKISDNSNRMMEAMDDIVWSINPMNDSMQRITARMREFATGVLEAKNIEVSFRVDEKVNDLRLGMESRRDLFLIFKEAVNNLAKYSKATHAVIDVSVQGNRLMMQIRDDGQGFDVQAADSGNGLSNMRKRAESLRSDFVIESVPGIGTKVRLEMPLT